MNNSDNNMAWAYGLDGWRKIDDPFIDKDFDDYDEFLREQGYSCKSTFTSGMSLPCGGIEVIQYEGNGDAYPYIVFVDDIDMNHHITIFVDNFPSLLGLMKELYAYQNMSVIELWYEFMTNTINRAFRVWHGHDARNVCNECDPEEHQRILKLRQRIRKSRNERR